MRFRELVLGAALLASSVTSSSATMLISEDRGGQIGHYLQTFAMLRSTGEHVVIDGNCLSACTLVLGIIPRTRICVTPRARLGFHAAWMPDADGRPVTSPMGTQALWNLYPTSVRRWINRHGGLSRKMIYMQGHDLAGVVPMCNATRTAHTHIRSHHRTITTAQMARYQRASAARDSH
ncbi:MAG: hypothetical protein WA792_17480 [Pseudolabrys sp.]